MDRYEEFQEQRIVVTQKNKFFCFTTMCLIFLLHALPFINRPAIIGGDEPHYALMAHSIAFDRDVYLENDYRSIRYDQSNRAGIKFRGKNLDHHTIVFDGREIASHPVGLPAFAAPLVFLHELVLPGVAPDVLLSFISLVTTFFALLAGWRLITVALGNQDLAAFITFGFYFSTPLWFYSRTFFTEPFLWSFAVFAVWAISKCRLTLASLFLGLAFLIKEPAVLIILLILLWTMKYRGFWAGLRLSIGPALSFGIYILKNLAVYGRAIVTFQSYQIGNPLDGFIGLLVDFQHGLFPFAPLAFIACVGWFLGQNPDTAYLIPKYYGFGTFAVYYIMVACWADWTGGSGYGPRLLVPVLPVFVLPLCCAWLRWRDSRIFRWTLYAIMLLGFFIQWKAACEPFHAFWSMPVGKLLTTSLKNYLTALPVLMTLYLFVHSRRHGTDWPKIETV